MGEKQQRRLDISGMKFGKLTAIEKVGYGVDKAGKRYALWRCECECGGEKICNQHKLICGYLKSCGCLRQKHYDGYNNHGMSNSKIYHVYRGILNRCLHEKDMHYKDYGGRGIKVCEEWHGKDGFINFYKWSINNGYAEGLSIDRIDVNGNYEPSNCRWATAEQQCNNQRSNIYHLVNGEYLQIKDIAQKYNINIHTLQARIYQKHMSAQEAVDFKRTFKYSQITINGETKSLKEWSEISGLTEDTLRYRIKKGYTDNALLSKSLVGMQKKYK